MELNLRSGEDAVYEQMFAFQTDGTDREKRWMLLASTGDHSWLGRHSDPTDAELTKLAQQLSRLGLSGWLCVAEGDYWSEVYYAVIEIRILAGNDDFQEALNLFNQKRMFSLKQ